MSGVLFALGVFALIYGVRAVWARRRAIWLYLSEAIVLTRRTFLLLALATGLAISVGAIAIRGLADERSQRSADARATLRKDLERQVADARAQAEEAKRRAAIARRLARLERPSVERLLAALRKAQRSPRAARLVAQEFRKLGLITTAPPNPSATNHDPDRPQPSRPDRAPRPQPRPGGSSPPPSSSSPPPQHPPPTVTVPSTPQVGPVPPVVPPTVCVFTPALPPLPGNVCIGPARVALHQSRRART